MSSPLPRSTYPILGALILATACAKGSNCSGDTGSPVNKPATSALVDVGTPPAPPPPPALPPPPPPPPEPGPPSFSDTFQGEALNLKRWARIKENDFRHYGVEIQQLAGGAKPERVLTLLADTYGTDDATVKYLGAHTRAAFDFKAGKRFAVDIDWNNQSNSAYLTAAIYLCPTVTDGNPEEEPDWLKFEYVGVPQDNGVRSVVAQKVKGIRRWLDREGWPAKRSGRVVRRNRIEIILDAADIVIYEAGREKFSLREHDLGFTQAAVYLVMSSHSNYMQRTILFDNVIVEDTEVPR